MAYKIDPNYLTLKIYFEASTELSYVLFNRHSGKRLYFKSVKDAAYYGFTFYPSVTYIQYESTTIELVGRSMVVSNTRYLLGMIGEKLLK